MMPIWLAHSHSKINPLEEHDFFSTTPGVSFQYRYVFKRIRLIRRESKLNKHLLE